MDWMAQSKKEVLQLHLQLQLVLEFSMRQGEALPETLPYHFNIDTQDTLILL
jgi:hypothetical protein